MVSLAFW